MLNFHGVLVLLALFASASALANDTTTLARELVQVKGGYIAKKRLREEMRLRAYAPLMLKAVGKEAPSGIHRIRAGTP